MLPGLREISWGEHNGEVNEGATLASMTRVLDAWQAGDLDAAAPGGESPRQAWARAIADVAPVLERHARDDVVLVAHGRLNKVLLSGLVHGDLARMEDFPQANAGITRVEGPAPWRVLAVNERGHLARLRRSLEERAS